MKPIPRERIVQATSRAAKLLHRLDVDHRYAQQAQHGRKQPCQGPLILRLRVSELERVFLSRYGRELPDDDAGRDDFEIVAQHIARQGNDVMKRLTAWASLWAPWMPLAEVANIVDEVVERPISWDADSLGIRLGLTDAERTKLQIRTIGGIDVNKAERIERRDEKRRLRCLAWRAKHRTGRPRGRPKLNANALKLISTTAFAFNSARRFDATITSAPPETGSQGQPERAKRAGRTEVFLFQSQPLIMLRGSMTRKVDADRGIARQ